MTGESTVTTDELRQLGREARSANAILEYTEFDGTNVRGCCIEVTEDFINRLINYGLPKDDLHQWRCKVGDQKELHYAVSMPAALVSDVASDTERLIVDATLDQFCTEQKQRGRVKTAFGDYTDLPDVDIVHPDDSRWTRYQPGQEL